MSTYLVMQDDDEDEDDERPAKAHSGPSAIRRIIRDIRERFK